MSLVSQTELASKVSRFAHMAWSPKNEDMLGVQWKPSGKWISIASHEVIHEKYNELLHALPSTTFQFRFHMILIQFQSQHNVHLQLESMYTLVKCFTFGIKLTCKRRTKEIKTLSHHSLGIDWEMLHTFLESLKLSYEIPVTWCPDILIKNWRRNGSSYLPFRIDFPGCSKTTKVLKFLEKQGEGGGDRNVYVMNESKLH